MLVSVVVVVVGHIFRSIDVYKVYDSIFYVPVQYVSLNYVGGIASCLKSSGNYYNMIIK